MNQHILKKHLKYWVFGMIFWLIWMLKYLLDHVLSPGEIISYNSYTLIMAIIVIPYISGLLISYLYTKLHNTKFVWAIKNQLKFWIFGIIIRVTWYVFVFALEPFLPNWWNNTYTIIFFATLPSYFGGLLVNHVIVKWMKSVVPNAKK